LTPLRLQTFLARAGVAARRKCEELIARGQVRVNGRVVTEMGTKVDPARDEVSVDGRAVRPEEQVHLVLHKPRGYVTTAHDPEGRPTVLDLVSSGGARLFPVGRLDFATDGVLVLTNDGELAHALMHPSRGVPKTYHAKLQGAVPPTALDRLRRGVRLDDGEVTHPADVRLLESQSKHTWLELTIKEGRNRQIHRMGDAIGHPVVKLTRVRYGTLTVEDLAPGKWRPLRRQELEALRALAGIGHAPHPSTRKRPPRRPVAKTPRRK
jgi:23S rRNA pseudouridine2605 synthase